MLTLYATVTKTAELEARLRHTYLAVAETLHDDLERQVRCILRLVQVEAWLAETPGAPEVRACEVLLAEVEADLVYARARQRARLDNVARWQAIRDRLAFFSAERRTSFPSGPARVQG